MESEQGEGLSSTMLAEVKVPGKRRLASLGPGTGESPSPQTALLPVGQGSATKAGSGTLRYWQLPKSPQTVVSSYHGEGAALGGQATPTGFPSIGRKDEPGASREIVLWASVAGNSCCNGAFLNLSFEMSCLAPPRLHSHLGDTAAFSGGDPFPARSALTHSPRLSDIGNARCAPAALLASLQPSEWKRALFTGRARAARRSLLHPYVYRTYTAPLRISRTTS